MTRLAQLFFALLVIATGAAFFLAQKLKTADPVLLSFRISAKAISPNGDGRFERQRITFRLKRNELIDVAVVDDRGDQVRELVSGLRLPAYRTISPLVWNGRDQQGVIVADGRYRIRVTLRREGRSIVVPQSFLVDTTPPKVRVISIGPGTGPGPEMLPRADGRPAEVTLNSAARDGRLLVFRTAPLPVEQVAEVPIEQQSDEARWDGRGANGRPVAPGTYLVVAQRRDAAGVLGSSVPLDAQGLPVTVYGQRLPGRGGITVRPIAAQPPLLPTSAGSSAVVAVDGGGERYSWSLSSLGKSASRRGRSSAGAVRVKPPGKSSQLFLFTAKRGALRSSVPLAVDDGQKNRVLVVLGLMTWQGRNPVDDDGDGEPNLLSTGGPVKLARVLGSPLPARFALQEKPIMSWLGRNRYRYDLTTDYGLARGRGPKLEGHSGVLLVGDTVWLPPAVASKLRNFVADGGTLVEAGTDSLLRSVTLTKKANLVRPLPAATADIFGSTLEPAAKGNFDVTAGDDEIDLFRGTSGLFNNYEAIEATKTVPEAKPLASAVTPEGALTIVAFRVGKGTVIRFGLPQLPSRLTTDPDVQGLMTRSWQLLSR